jgi:4-carboxymuconolactone decarboxylase
MTRIATPTLDEMTPEQRRIHDDIVASRGNYSNGPFPPLMHQPRIAEPTQKLGEFVRYHTSLSSRLTELAILIVARHWDCNFEWHQHVAIALSNDVQPGTVESIRNGERPTSLREDEDVLYEFASTLLERHSVPARIYAKASDLFGAIGVVELTALLGYYSMLALSLNAHEVSLPSGIEPPLAPRSLR